MLCQDLIFQLLRRVNLLFQLEPFLQLAQILLRQRHLLVLFPDFFELGNDQTVLLLVLGLDFLVMLELLHLF